VALGLVLGLKDKPPLRPLVQVQLAASPPATPITFSPTRTSAMAAVLDPPPPDALPTVRTYSPAPALPPPGSLGTGTTSTTDFTAALYAFLDRLSEAMVTRLYDAPASCLSLFR